MRDALYAGAQHVCYFIRRKFVRWRIFNGRFGDSERTAEVITRIRKGEYHYHRFYSGN